MSATTARALLEASNPFDLPAEGKIAAAQVEATLAVAEQLRISNVAIIAERFPFVELGNGAELISAAFTESVTDEHGFRSDRIRPDIAEALHLGSSNARA